MPARPARQRRVATPETPSQAEQAALPAAAVQPPVHHRFSALTVQPKLTVGPANDPAEREADRVAATVVHHSAGQIQRASDSESETEEAESTESGPASSPPVELEEAESEETESSEDATTGTNTSASDTAPGSGVGRISSGASTGVPVDPALEQAIEGARGGGTPLPANVQQQMSDQFKFDFSDVRIHTGPVANQATAALGARAFTTGSDIFFRQGEYRPNDPAGQQLLAHELTHVVQQNGSGGGVQRVQRAVGYEFETGWGVVEKVPGTFKSKRKPFHKGQILHAYQGFNMTVDETSTELGGAIEWVVDPPIPETAGVGTLDGIMQRLEALAAQIEPLNARPKFTMDEATGDPRDSYIEVYPSIAGGAANMPANPQITGGIRLDMMAKLFEELGNRNQHNDAHSQARSDLMTTGEGMMAVAAQRANTIAGSDKLRGLAAQIIAYLRAGAMPIGAVGPGQAYKYAKLIGKIMARTDFGSQFKMLDLAERQPFEQNPQTFATLILNAAGLGGGAHVFERKVRKDPNDVAKGVFTFPVSRQDWLIGIVNGSDMLSSKHMPQWKSELEGLGALGSKTDRVNNNVDPGVIVEFRQARANVPYTQWRAFATRIFNYIVYMNGRDLDAEENLANMAELPQGF